MLSERSHSSAVVFDADAVIASLSEFRAEPSEDGHDLVLHWRPLPSAAGVEVAYAPADNRLVPAGQQRVIGGAHQLRREWGRCGGLPVQEWPGVGRAGEWGWVVSALRDGSRIVG